MKPPNHGCRVRVTDGQFTFEGHLVLEDRIPESPEWRGLLVRDGTA